MKFISVDHLAYPAGSKHQKQMLEYSNMKIKQNLLEKLKKN